MTYITGGKDLLTLIFIILYFVGYALNFCTTKCVLDNFVHLVCLFLGL